MKNKLPPHILQQIRAKGLDPNNVEVLALDENGPGGERPGMVQAALNQLTGMWSAIVTMQTTCMIGALETYAVDLVPSERTMMGMRIMADFERNLKKEVEAVINAMPNGGQLTSPADGAECLRQLVLLNVELAKHARQTMANVADTLAGAQHAHNTKQETQNTVPQPARTDTPNGTVPKSTPKLADPSPRSAGSAGADD